MENKVIIRIDDIGRKNYSIVIKQMLEELSKRKIPFTLGVIACELENDGNYIVSLKEIVTKNNSEFALHGYYHKKDVDENSEFKVLSKEDARKLIQKGKKIMQEKLGITPTVFISPWYESSDGTKEALAEEGFTILSEAKDEFEKSKLLSLGYNARTATFQPHMLVALAQIKEECEKSFEKRGYCVINIHPQDYLIDDEGDQHKPDIDFEKYKQFIHLLDYLEYKKVEFTTFSEMSKKF